MIATGREGVSRVSPDPESDSASASGSGQSFTCTYPGCGLTVEYNPSDRRHQATGALLVSDKPSARGRPVYLRCGNNHRGRYELPAPR
jgi:hypothetical protein